MMHARQVAIAIWVDGYDRSLDIGETLSGSIILFCQPREDEKLNGGISRPTMTLIYIAETTIIRIQVRKIMPALLVRLIIVRTTARTNRVERSPRIDTLTISTFKALLPCNFLTLSVIEWSSVEVAPTATNIERIPNTNIKEKKRSDRTAIH